MAPVEPRAKGPLRFLAAHLLVAAKGACMGAADLVPGVSGGTMALILGVYGQLLGGIRALTQRSFWQDLLALRFQTAFQTVHGRFLVALGVGILSSIVLLAGPIAFALQEYPIYIWSFFFGLVLASTVLVGQRVTHWNWSLALICLGTAGAAFWLVGLTPAQTPETWWFVLMAGALALCAMILPGVSGSYVLVLLGKYQYMLEALHQRDLAILLLFMCGGVLGLLSFARGLTWLLRHHVDATMAALSGLLLGSLRRIWPWQGDPVPEGTAILSYYLPPLERGQFPWELTTALAIFVLGLGLVLALHRLAQRMPAHSLNTLDATSVGLGRKEASLVKPNLSVHSHELP